MFGLSMGELIVIGIVALIVIGPERLPKVARTVGHLVGRAQRYVTDIKSDIQREMDIQELTKIKQDIQSGAEEIKSSFEKNVASIKDPFEEIKQDLGDTNQQLTQELGELPDLSDLKKPLNEPATAPSVETTQASGLAVAQEQVSAQAVVQEQVSAQAVVQEQVSAQAAIASNVAPTLPSGAPAPIAPSESTVPATTPANDKVVS